MCSSLLLCQTDVMLVGLCDISVRGVISNLCEQYVYFVFPAVLLLVLHLVQCASFIRPSLSSDERFCPVSCVVILLHLHYFIRGLSVCLIVL